MYMYAYMNVYVFLCSRIPYVVITGEPTARLMDLVVDPHTILQGGKDSRINFNYYINKQVNR